MVTKKVITKKIAKKTPDAWHLKAAYALGKATQKASKAVNKVKVSSKKLIAKTKSKKTGTQVSLFEPSSDKVHEPLSPVLKEIKAIMDVSGLTAAIDEMNEISLKNSRHPVIERLVTRVRELSQFEQEQLSRKFIEKLNAKLHFDNMAVLLPSQVKLTEEDCQKMSDAFIGCISETLEDLGLSEEDRAVFEKLTGDIAKPINDLMLFYMYPKTFKQKIKRLWRMQRIFIKMIKLVRLTNELNKQMPMANDFSPFKVREPAEVIEI
ncbi:MAG: hypothetical protein HQL25_06440 [Candidatus Omnitrophica bacterium]|nr:hypothetical protein [Candidatus Omnitrophota bacterium]